MTNASQNFQCADALAGLRMSLVLKDMSDCVDVRFLALQLDGIFASEIFFTIGMTVVTICKLYYSKMSLILFERCDLRVLMI